MSEQRHSDFYDDNRTSRRSLDRGARHSFRKRFTASILTVGLLSLCSCTISGRNNSIGEAPELVQAEALKTATVPGDGQGAAPVASTMDSAGIVRGTGKLQAANQEMMLAPRLQGRSNRFTLTYLIPNGSQVKAGDVLAEFDRTEQTELARTAAAQLDDLNHKIESRRAENRANAAKRSAELREAQAELDKARIQLRIAEIRSEIDAEKNRVRAAFAAKRIERLGRIHKLRTEADDAELRILELQRDRQQISLERAEQNSDLLVMKAPIDGMVALEAIWRSGSRGPAQVGDQIYRGNPIMRIFDPTRMELAVELGEPDGAVLVKGTRAEIVLDAYPHLRFHGTLLSASPVAAAALGSPIRRFYATFAVEEIDPHLLPDLSAQVTIHPRGSVERAEARTP